MKRAILACMALVALTAIRGLAAEPAAESKAGPKDKPSPKATADAPQPVIPKREFTFDVSEEEQPMAFDASDPKVLEQRYCANVVLIGPARLRTVTFGPFAPEAISGYVDAVSRHRALLFGKSKPIPAVLKSALGEMPQERLPSEEIVSLLRQAGYPYLRRSFVRVDPRTEDDKHLLQLTILAPTPERAKELVQGVLSFYDFGVFYPLQKEALAVIGEYEKRLAEDRASLKGGQDELATLKKQLANLKEFEDITPAALANFITQQRLISVEMQGVKARIDACNKILGGAGRRLTPPRVEQLETIKITAEIELVGLAARKKALEEIVKQGRERKEVSAKRVHAQLRVSSLGGEISHVSSGIAHYKAELKKCAPYPFAEEKVVIRRIKWVPPEKLREER
ncbi:MAG: hypothetical protein ACYSWU_14495 [Planctomycetota bacterium]|jgi:hypothetical protein